MQTVRAGSSSQATLQSQYLVAFNLANEQRRDAALVAFGELQRAASSPEGATSSTNEFVTPGSPFYPETATPAEFEREAAYQHAVLTAVVVNKPAAAKEYLALIREFPESEQAEKAVRRLAAMHGGKLLPAEQRAWEAAQAAARKAEHQRMRANAMCGPEVVRELLRRRAAVPGSRSPVQEVGGTAGEELRPREGSKAAASGTRGTGSSHLSERSAGAPHNLLDLGPGTLDSLAKELKTDEFGTTVQAIQKALARRGYKAKGLRLTLPALWNKPLPAVALLKQGHFVLVDRIAEGTVETWDPDAGESGAAARRYTWPEFEKAWTGSALIFESK
jgi:hypothetical protein